MTIEYSCPGRIRDTELAKTARVAPRAEEEGVRSRSGRIGERVGSIPQYAVKRAYTVNGVKYVVGAKFRHWQSKDNFADRIKKYITSDFAHLSVGTQDDIIEAEYVCCDCEASKDARKED